MKLQDILDDVDNNKLVLPDFQRDYVWAKEDEKITSFISSVLAQLPIGSIIKFKGAKNSFANKVIGFNKSISIDSLEDNIDFLLDGQQRITTLSFVFADRIFQKVINKTFSSDDLVQNTKIKKRYFLTLPHFDDEINSLENDLFGFKNLDFPPFNPSNVPFCSTDVLSLIQCEPFTFSSNFTGKNSPFHPCNTQNWTCQHTNSIKNECKKDCKIPLFLLTDDPNKQGISSPRYVLLAILQDLATYRKDYLLHKYGLPMNVQLLKNYIEDNSNSFREINLDDDDKNITETFQQVINDKCRDWATKMRDYLISCIDNLKIQEFTPNSEIERAINMYEALNKGGVHLSTFDLIVARAAAAPNNTGQRYTNGIKEILNTYCNKNIFKEIQPPSQYWNNKNNWNSKDFLNTINKDDEISSIVINQFLNLLCFVSNNTDNTNKMLPNPNFYNECCKANAQLKLTSSQIVTLSPICMKSIVDALMILQFKCGVFDVSKIDYNLILFPLSYIMYLYENNEISTTISLRTIINRFYALYLYCIFTGEYSSDQSTVVMKHVKWVHDWFKCGNIPDPFNNKGTTTVTVEQNTTQKNNLIYYIDDKVLQKPDYNDKDTLLLLHPKEIYPKNAVYNSIYLYVLSKCPCDILQSANHLNAWYNGDPFNKIEFEDHHIIPLATDASIGKSTKTLRNDKKNQLNSPLNRALISKHANRQIGTLQPTAYKDCLSPKFISDYFFDNSILNTFNNTNLPTNITSALTTRYENLKKEIIKDIKNHIK